jgi:flagellar hook-associated protein 3 FlgL
MDSVGFSPVLNKSRVEITDKGSDTVKTRFTGSEVFQQPGVEVFDTLIALRDDLRNPSFTNDQRVAQLTQRMQTLEGAQKAVLGKVGEQSASLVRLEALQTRLDDLKLNNDIRLGELEGTDYAEAVLKLREQESIFQATLGVTARSAAQQNLLDFIR